MQGGTAVRDVCTYFRVGYGPPLLRQLASTGMPFEGLHREGRNLWGPAWCACMLCVGREGGRLGGQVAHKQTVG